MKEESRKDALTFLTRHHSGVIATRGEGDAVHASMVHYTADEEFNIYFLTQADSRKFKALSAHPQVAFTVSTPDVPQTLQLEGLAMDISLDQEAAKKKEELMRVLNLNPWFDGPITKLDPSETVVVWIKPTWVRWADYAFADAGTKNIFTQIIPAK